jgi:hypothetical protein
MFVQAVCCCSYIRPTQYQSSIPFGLSPSAAGSWVSGPFIFSLESHKFLPGMLKGEGTVD